MTRISCVLVGGESLLICCAEILIGRGHHVAAVVSGNAGIVAWADGLGIPLRARDALSDLSFDWLFSVANLSRVPDEVLALPTCGAISFHDGPLPRYAGLNAPAWAILNGETRHGVAWHRIAGGVNEGDLLATREFAVAPDETAFTLNAKCYAAAVDSFGDLLADLEGSGLRPVPQDLTRRSYFARNLRPEAGGLIEFALTPTRISALVRGLDHGTYRNPMCRAKILAGGRVVLVGQADQIAGRGARGEVLAVDSGSMTIAATGGAVRLSDLTTPDGNRLDPTGLAQVGLPLSRETPDRAALTEVIHNAAAGEPYWRRALSDARPIRIPLLSAGGGAGVVVRALRLPDRLDTYRIAAIAAAVALRSAGETEGDIALSTAACPAPGFLSDWVPLRLAGDTFAEASEALGRAMSYALRYPSYATDLIARDPGLSAPAMPDLGLSLTADAIPGCPLTLCLTPRGAMLRADAALVPQAAFDLIAARIETLAGHAAADALPLDRLPVMSPAELEETLRENNETRWRYDPALLHAPIETQADRRPDATALIFGTETLSHGDLEARANRIAHVLRAQGVVPGQPVGLFCRRGLDLIAGALGILKAGGAYVPMDPTCPADRIAHYIADSGAQVIVTQAALTRDVPAGATALAIDTDPRVAQAPPTRPEAAARPEDLAYLIYTPGSTGSPKGVMVEHRNTANFFAGMDAAVDHQPGDTWMAVTGLSFDIAVLELFYALARGFRVVIGGDPDRMRVAGAASTKPMDFSLFYWGNDVGPGAQKFKLLPEGAKFADANGFTAVWTSERHFHAFGGPYPNPAVTGAAVAAATQNIAVRAGSCVAPLHHPARIAEEWAVIDNLTHGRTGIGFALGWQPDDFVLRPENTPPADKAALFDTLDQVRRLWRGEAVPSPRADGKLHDIVTRPRPVSKELAVWVTTAGNPDTWREAGANGCNVLTHLLGQSIDEVAGKIAIYREALAQAGHDPDAFKVTLMLHSFLADDRETARDIAREPMKDYLRAATGLIKQYAWAFPAFKKPAGMTNPMQIDLGSLSEDEMDGILDFAFQRYFEDSGLFGTVDDAVARVESLKAIGVDEIACLIDYGIAPDMVLEGLKPLVEVLRRTNTPSETLSLADLITRHKATHLQCTPSMAQMICMNDDARAALGGLRQILLGGEALPGSLVRDVSAATAAQIVNMYGQTETTIWSTTSHPVPDEDTASIGRPIANTQVYVFDPHGDPAPIGVPGELYIGGDGVTRGYWNRPDLTAERFVADPVTGGRMYRTGDLVRWRADGKLDFLSRIDHQITLRGHLIELGEIEARLTEIPGVTEAAVIARNDTGDTRLVAYVTGTAPETKQWRAHLSARLPEFMIPADLVALDAFPLTPNRKIDRDALPAPVAQANDLPAVKMAPQTSLESQIIAIFARHLGEHQVGAEDNFFALGGHSLLAVQAHRDLKEVLGKGRIEITDFFRFPTARGLAAHLDAAGPQSARNPDITAPDDTGADTIEARRALRRNRVKEAG